MKYFGTDGIRGIYGTQLTERLAYNAGLAAASLFDVCFVVRDTRPSGEPLAAALISGLKGGGCTVKNAGVLPTPAAAYLSGKYKVGAVSVTASHNPPEYNGLKFFYKGYKLSSACENMLEYEIDFPPAHIGGGRERFYDGRSEYIDHLVLSAGSDLCGKRIALDCAYGATCGIAEETFERCNADVVAICDEMCGEKIGCGVGALYPRNVLPFAPLGFSFDGDGDRLAVTDGDVLDGDSALYDLALMLSPSGVVGTVMNNPALEYELGKIGIPFIRTAVGDRHIGEKMRATGYELGGEQSGHYIIAPASSGDALLSALLLARADGFKRLDLVPQYETSVSSSEKALYDKRFTQAVEECKREFSGRLVVRFSGTEPKIRLMAQSENERQNETTIKRLTDVIAILNKEYGV